MKRILLLVAMVLLICGSIVGTNALWRYCKAEMGAAAPVVPRGSSLRYSRERTLHAGLALQALIQREGSAASPEAREEQVRRAYAYADDILRLQEVAP